MNQNSIAQIIDEINKDAECNKLLCLNQSQVAKMLGVSSSTLENWRKEGLGPEFKKVNHMKKGRILYPKLNLARWISQTIETL